MAIRIEIENLPKELGKEILRRGYLRFARRMT
jgi:hypothetical protein